MSNHRMGLIVGAGALLVTMLPVTTAAGGHGFITSDPPLLTVNVGGGKVTPILGVGDTVDGVMFEGLPDGLGLVPDFDGDPGSKGRKGQRPATVDLYVAHEQTTVPFRGSRDFTDASVTRWTLDTRSGSVLSSGVAIESSEGFLRFCSAAVATPADGFDTHVFFANEETNDIVDVAPGATTYGADSGIAPQRQGGYAVALDTATGEYKAIAGMGRHNHENTVAVPGYDDIVLWSGDDTFSATTSQLYMYRADDQEAMFADDGVLYAFRVTDKNGAPLPDPTDPQNGSNDYLDLGVDDEMSGEFIAVPEDVAKGTVAGEAPQDSLENWSIDNNVFTFVRLEDIAVDKNDSTIVYVADTGASRVKPTPDGRIGRPAGPGFADNGRVFKFVLDPDDPLAVDSFTVFADGDAPADHPKYVGFTSPDNIETGTKSLMVQEDADFGQIWQHKFSNGNWRAVADVVDTGGESSGIVDASTYFGPGSWLVTVQAHDFEPVDVDTATISGITIKREEGQLLLMKIPGS